MSHSPSEAVDPQRATRYVDALNRLAMRIESGESHSGRENNCCFLNTQLERFANISALSGFDFADDARAIALTDWDRDGDLDVWVANRTGPQVRFLNNNHASANRSIAFRLQGTSTNRDGIGARVEVHLRGIQQPLVKSIYGGHGFLAQSSKWVHFGLGTEADVERVVVRWATDDVEDFRNVLPNRRYRLVQGSGTASVVDERDRDVVKLIPSRLKPKHASMQASVWLAARPPVANLKYERIDGTRLAADITQGSVLINLWASWCHPCMKELAEFAQAQDALKDKGVSILALNVDALSDSQDLKSPTKIANKLNELQLPGGFAHEELVRKLELTYWKTFGRRTSLPVPSSFLIDDQGRVAAVFLGAMDVDQFVVDVDHLDHSPQNLRSWSDPIKGRWRKPVGEFNVSILADAYVQAGLHEDAATLLQSATIQGKADANTLNTLGAALLESGDRDGAEIQFRKALSANPNLARARYNLALVLMQRNLLSDAKPHLQKAIEISPELFDARLAMARVLEAETLWEQAEQQYRAILAIDAAHAKARNGVAMTLARQGRLDEAEVEFRGMLEQSDSPEVRYNLARLLLDKGHIDQAEQQLQIAFSDEKQLAGHLNQLGLEMSTLGRTTLAQRLFQSALLRDKENVDLHFNLATEFYRAGDLAQAVEHYENAHILAPDNSQVANALAWVLATNFNDKLRRPDEALRLAQIANESEDEPSPEYLNTLAAAQAATGDYGGAVASAQKAIRLARQIGKEPLALRIASRLQLYQNDMPYIEGPP